MVARCFTKFTAASFALLMLAGTARAELFAPSQVSTSSNVERVKKEYDGPKNKTTRCIKVRLSNMSPNLETIIGVECWMIYRDLGSNNLGVQHQQKSIWRMPPGHLGQIVADEALFEYTPMQIRGSGFRHGFVRAIPASGKKYYGYVVRVYENGRVINEISSASNLPALADQSYFSAENKAANPSKYSTSTGGQTSIKKSGQL